MKLGPAILGSTVLSLLSSGCHHFSHFSHDSRLVVDGVELESEHEETLDVGSWDASGLTVESGLGDVRVETADGGNTITVTLHEVTEGDASAAYEGGRLVVRTTSGKPAMIGDVVVRTAAALPSLSLHSDMGDLSWADASVEGPAEMSTGMGDVRLERVRSSGTIQASTGMGDVEVRGGDAGELSVKSGMGDLDVRDFRATTAHVTSGMGSLDFRGCVFATLNASTGQGSVDCRDTEYGDGDLSTGLGPVRIR